MKDIATATATATATSLEAIDSNHMLDVAGGEGVDWDALRARNAARYSGYVGFSDLSSDLQATIARVAARK